MSDDEFGVVPHDCLSLHMDLLQNFATPPTSNETDDIIIHTGTEECHGASRLKVPRRDIFVCENQMGPC